MAVTNNLKNALAKKAEGKVVEFQVGGESVQLTPNMVKAYLTNGDGAVTDQEVAMFINLCKYQKLNPLIKDAYLIKYGKQPATIVTSKDAIMKRAMRNPNYGGHQAGVIVLNPDTGELSNRTGSMVLPGETVVGGWAKTYVKGYEAPIEITVGFDEYAGKTKEGKLNTMWANKPGVMIRKVALAACLREAFPEDLQGMYASEETGTDISDPVPMPIEIPDQPEIIPEPQPVDPKPVEVPQPEQEAPDDVDGMF